MNQIKTYAAPKGAVLNETHRVWVRIPEGEWHHVPCYQVKVDMHQVRESSMAYFDFSGQVEVKIEYTTFQIYHVDIRPLSRNIQATTSLHEITFTLNQPENLSIEINKERFRNLHLFANNIPIHTPNPQDPNVKYLSAGIDQTLIHRTQELAGDLKQMPEGRTLYFGPGRHYLEECLMCIPSHTNIYIHGEAVIVGAFVCDRVEHVRIYGRGVVYLASFERFTGINGIRLSHACHIQIEGIHFINPPHYTVYVGGSHHVDVRDIKSFSCEGWSDGVDMMSSQDVTISDCFLRNSDDCIAIYGSRWAYRGDTQNIHIKNCTLWADVAHPTIIGTHGDYNREGDTIENINFENIDILEHHEYQAGYLGCLAINAGDKNTVKNVTYRDIRIEPFERGKILDIQIKMNQDYNPAPGNKIENILFQNIFYTGDGDVTSLIQGYDNHRTVQNVTFKNIYVRGKKIKKLSDANIQIGDFAEDIQL